MTKVQKITLTIGFIIGFVKLKNFVFSYQCIEETTVAPFSCFLFKFIFVPLVLLIVIIIPILFIDLIWIKVREKQNNKRLLLKIFKKRELLVAIIFFFLGLTVMYSLGPYLYGNFIHFTWGNLEQNWTQPSNYTELTAR